MQMYQPNKPQDEAFDWAIKANRIDLVDAIRAMQDCFEETHAEAGRYLDEYASASLARVNAHLKTAYINCNNEWADAYRKAGF